MVKLTDLIAPSFYEIYHDIVNNDHVHYKLKGGRGSTKSSFVSVVGILLMHRHPEINGFAVRKYGTSLEGSVFAQILWAINALGERSHWKIKTSPYELTYTPTGQKIIFSGVDDPEKLKSRKLEKGYFGFGWFEEYSEFSLEEIRSVLQSMMRGGAHYWYFYTFNPPRSLNSWVNQDVLEIREDTRVHHSTYLDVPPAWLGDQFLIEAEELKKRHPDRYEHEYMGVPIGTGGQVFNNVTIRTISDEEIGHFDRIRQGIDFGYATDPFTFNRLHYDATRKRIYVFDEIHAVGMSNRKAIELVQAKNPDNRSITADSAEPKSIAEFNSYGLRVMGAKKGPDSIDFGIKFLTDLDEIIIDPIRCPNTKREFTSYELERDRDGNFKANYPDKDNHHIDAIRYALEADSAMRRAIITNKARLGLF